MSSNVDRATAVTQDVIDSGVPWSSEANWQIVLTEAIGAGILGLILLFDLGGASTILKLVGLVLLGLSLVGAFQVWRRRVVPDRTNLASFRSGSGITTGVLVIVATILVGVTDAVTAAVAVAVGVGFILYGLAGLVGAFIGREPGERLPTAVVGVNGAVLAIGVVLLFAGMGGAGTVRSAFTLLGILLIVLGVGLGGFAYLLHQRQAGTAA